METSSIPEIKPKHVQAFIAMLLHKAGGHQTIKLELLEKFDEKNESTIWWNAATESFTLLGPNEKVPTSLIRIGPGINN